MACPGIAIRAREEIQPGWRPEIVLPKLGKRLDDSFLVPNPGLDGFPEVEHE